jgi:hypothetical protein
MFKKFMDMVNGHKMNTGVILVVLPPIMSQMFGISQDEATHHVTTILAAAGAVLAIIGYIHKLVKGGAVK